MNKYASLYLTKLSQSLNPDDIVVSQKDRGPLQGYLSDFLLLPESQRRSGRISAMQEAAGIEPTMTQRYPITSRILKQIGGSGVGFIAGNYIGKALSSDPSAPSKQPAFALGGGLAGLGVMTLVDLIQKRMADREAIDQVRQSNDLDVRNIEKGNPVASLLSGMHQKGRSEVAQALAGKNIKKDIKLDQAPMTTAFLARPAISALPYMAGSVVNYAKSQKDLANAKRTIRNQNA